MAPLPAALLAEGARHLAVGYVAGGAGAAAVYPADVVKTRLQADKRGEFNGPVHCFKTLMNNGALYRGLGAQLLGVAPEKMLKLAAYTSALPFAYAAFSADGSGAVCVPAEALAGACGGFAQVAITCPIEVLKIRQQLASMDEDLQDATHPYRGLLCTWARDVPSGAIFFSAYTPLHLSLCQTLADPVDGTLSTSASFLASMLAAVIAGIPAAALPTPADVIKTRMQAAGSPFQNGYECLVSVVEEEGVQALAYGAWSRVARLAPQLGITLALYSVLDPNA